MMLRRIVLPAVLWSVAVGCPAVAQERVAGVDGVERAERVVSTDAAITGIVEALNAADTLVGIDVTSTAPVGYENLPRVGYHRSLSAEGLLSLRPDLILASAHAGPPGTLEAVQALQVPVVQLEPPLTLDGLAMNVEQIASALARESEAAALLAQVDAQRATLARRSLGNVPTLLIRESNGALRVAGGATAGQALVSLIGARNVADFDGYRTYSAEALLASDPELLLVAIANDEDLAHVLARHPLLAHLTAIREERVFRVPGSALVGGLSLESLRVADGLLQRVVDEQWATAP